MLSATEEELVPLPEKLGRRIDLPMDRVLKVASGANVADLAWSVVKAQEEGYRPILACIGVQAVTQAVKSIAVANSRKASQGMIFTALPAFENVKISERETGEMCERTVIKLVCVLFRF